MAGVPLKFRCYQCNQLLGVSRNKIGTVVSCPKCRADLIVPDPGESLAPAAGDDADPAQSSSLGDDFEGGISLELLDIRPEDIRVEPGVTWTPQVEVPPREPFPFIPPDPATEVAAGTAPVGVAVEPLTGSGDQGSAASEAATSPPETVVPPIRLESSRLAEARVATTRARDVVLPRSVVAAWSLFVLIAQALAFVAGLLAGHFLWRVH